MARPDDFDSLLAEAQAQPFIGWDFSWVAKRIITQPLPWNYPSLVAKRAHESPDLLDLDTGGGEFLAGLAYRPQRTIATESYPPNVSVAARRLHPMNVQVVKVEGPPDNNVQTDDTRGHLPFRDSSFHLVVNRHASFVARDLWRILAPQGHFLTQQVGEQSHHDFHQLLGKAAPSQSRRPWNLSLASNQVEAASLRVTESGQSDEVMSFIDIGALAWYLKSVPWIVDDLSISRYQNRLKELHFQIQKRGPLQVRQSRFMLEAIKEK